MFSFFMRSSATPATPVVKSPSLSRLPKSNDPRSQSGPLPVPEVIEGNDDWDSALWEDSSSFHNSQLPSTASLTKPIPGTQFPIAQEASSPDAIDSIHEHAP